MKISALPVGVATSSTPFPAVVGGVTDQVTLSPVYTSLAGKAALSHTHAESDVTNLVADLANRVVGLVAFASLPAAGTAGALYYFTDSPYVARDNGVSYDYFYQGRKITPLDQSAWGWVNQGGATVVQSKGLVYMTGPSQVGRNMRLRVVTAPTPPYTVTALLWIQGGTTNFTFCGLAFRESSTSKIIPLIKLVSAHSLEFERDTNETTFSAGIGTYPLGLSNGTPIWFRIADDNTNLIASFSFDGVNFVTVGSDARTAFMAGGPNQVGIMVGCQSGEVQQMGVAAWNIT